MTHLNIDGPVGAENLEKPVLSLSKDGLFLHMHV